MAGERLVLVDRSADHELQQRLQLAEQPVHLDELRLGLAAAIDLAVYAVEVTDLVGVEINPQRNPLAPPR